MSLRIFGLVLALVGVSCVPVQVAPHVANTLLVSSKGPSRREKPLVVVSILGPPGVGKGAFSRHLAYGSQFLHISTGDLLREEVGKGTPLGREVNKTMSSGGLVADSIVAALIQQRLDAIYKARESGALASTPLLSRHVDYSDGEGTDPVFGLATPLSLRVLPEVPLGQVEGVILDGFPRTLSQCKLLDSGEFDIPRIKLAIWFTMPDAILAERRSGRRICPVCNLTYNIHPIDHDGYKLSARMPKVPGHCDADNSTLITRPDDAPAIAEQRMQEYHRDIDPIVAYYTKQGILLRIEKRRNASILYREYGPQIARRLGQKSIVPPPPKN